MLKFACKHIYVDCNWSYSSEDYDDLYDMIVEHLQENHEILEVNDDWMFIIEEVIIDTNLEDDEEEFDDNVGIERKEDDGEDADIRRRNYIEHY